MAANTRQQQNKAQNWLGKLSDVTRGIGQQIEFEKAEMNKNPNKFGRDSHIWGLEMPPTQVKIVETLSALATGYVGVRSLYYGLSAATDNVYEKGWVAGVLRKISGAVRSIFGFGTLAVAVAFAGHALSINPPNPPGAGRGN